MTMKAGVCSQTLETKHVLLDPLSHRSSSSVLLQLLFHSTSSLQARAAPDLLKLAIYARRLRPLRCVEADARPTVRGGGVKAA